MITFKLPHAEINQKCEVSVPGSKSYTNRALIIGAMTPGTVKIISPLVSDDTQAMISCLRLLGITVEVSDKQFIVSGDILDVVKKKVTLNSQLSGTTLRFLLALSTIVPADITLTGVGSLLERPIKEMVDCLIDAGADIQYLDKPGYPPVRIRSDKLHKNELTISGNISSQFLSALLMISPALHGLTLHVVNDVISKPYIDMTLEIMKQFGVTSKKYDYKKIVIDKDAAYKSGTYTVEGDMSSAAYFFAFASIAKREIKVNNLNPASNQADAEFIKILERMGTKFTNYTDAIQASGNGVKSIDVNMNNCPDQATTLAVLASFAKNNSHISGVKSLRIKETERIRAVQTELQKMGIRTDSSDDDLTIFPGKPVAAKISTYNDHRMAMSFAVASAVLTSLEIIEPEVVSKTFPNFWHYLYALNGKIFTANTNIVFIGLRGSGKTSIGKALQKQASIDFTDTDIEISSFKHKTVNEIVATEGWDSFREVESKVIKRIAELNHTVIATGGGAVLDSKNMKLLQRNGLIIWLRSSSAELETRLKGSDHRVSLTSQKSLQAEIRQIIKEREALYSQYADVIIDSEQFTLQQTLGEVHNAIRLLLP